MGRKMNIELKNTNFSKIHNLTNKYNEELNEGISNRKGTFYKLIYVDSAKSGFIEYSEIDKKKYRLSAIYLHPKYRNHGIGSRIISNLIKKNVITVEGPNEKMINLLLKNGLFKKENFYNEFKNIAPVKIVPTGSWEGIGRVILILEYKNKYYFYASLPDGRNSFLPVDLKKDFNDKVFTETNKVFELIPEPYLNGLFVNTNNILSELLEIKGGYLGKLLSESFF